MRRPDPITPAVSIEVSEDGADPARLDQSSRHLLRDLRKLGLPAELPAAQAPPGAKSGSAIAIATLLVGLAGTSASGSLVIGIFNWLGPRRGKVKISYGDTSIELSAATRAERDRLIEWLQANTEQTHQDPRDRDGERSS